MTDIEKIRQDIQSCLDIQLADGNWNYDAYMHGMANGLILAQSIVSGGRADFKEAPDMYIKDKEDLMTIQEYNAFCVKTLKND